LNYLLDSPNPRTSSVGSQPLQPLLRPDFQLFVRGFLILRWENKIDNTLLEKAVHENTSKLKAWSPLFYGKLPYVIGGCCAGRQFRWLKLYPKGEEILFELISAQYDLNMLSDVAKFLQTIIRMHCLLQKLQEELDGLVRVALYLPKKRTGGVEVTVYPDFVEKKLPILGTAKWTVLDSMYKSIARSRYLIRLASHQKTRNGAILRLQPVGDPVATPDNIGDLGDAIHDMLNGLADLHGKGYTHRDIRWDNCIKVNVKSYWKWVIIDLEAAGPQDEAWVDEWLTGWDAETLERKGKEKIYSKGSDMHQFGKLVAEWLNEFYVGSEENLQVMRSRADKMQQERIAAVKMLEDFCKKPCKRCRMFGTKL
jgi:hypothetical protein